MRIKTFPHGGLPALDPVDDAPQREARDVPLLTVLVPVFNEERTIASLLWSVLATPYDLQVIVVDDGSSDGTSAELEAWCDDPRLEHFAHETNRGKGAAIRTGLAKARGKFCIIQDADLEYSPLEYGRLLDPLMAGEAVVVYGSRYLHGRQERWRWLRYGVMVLNSGVWMIYGVRLADEATCYKAMPTELLRALDLECERFEFCSEVTAKLCCTGIPILEVPVTYHPRSGAEGKKLRWTDGWTALWTLWRWRKWSMRPEARRTCAKWGVC